MNKNCFAYCAQNICAALNVKTCPGERCPFYATPEQVKESRRKAYKLIACLGKAMQSSIATTYYSDKMPWLEDGADNEL